MRRLAYILLLVVAMTPVGPAAAKQADATAPIAGTIVDFEYHPPEINLTVGDSITWTNNGSRPHTVTDRGGLFDTDAILPGAQATVKLDVPGTYEFFCQINPSKMNGRLVVAPAATPPTEVRVQAFDEGRTGETKRFDPPQLEVSAGTRLILANVGGLRHSLKAEDGSFAIPIVEPGDENGRFAGHNGSVVVNAVGTHAFFCEIHPAVMKGTLVVTAKKVVAKAAPRATKVERPPPRATVAVAEFAFDKAETVVAAGGSVVWNNSGTKPHTATFDDVTLDTGTIAPGKSAQLTAPGRPGTYSYHCSIHNQMRGVLVVSPQRALAAAPAASTTPSGDTAGDVLAWTVAVLVVGVGIAGLFLGLRSQAA